MNWIYVDMWMFFQKRIIKSKLVSYLGLNQKLAMRHPIKVGIWWIGKWKDENPVDPSRSSKHFTKIAYLICWYNPTFHKHNDVQGTKFYQSLKDNLTNVKFLGRKEASVTAAIIISKSFDFNHAREWMEEQFSKLV